MIRPVVFVALLAGVALAVSGCGPTAMTSSQAQPLGVSDPVPGTTSATVSGTTSATPTAKSKPIARPPARPATTTQKTGAEKTGAPALMSKGDTGRQVRELQHRLRQLNWFEGTITGNYGRTTVIAVRGFQTKRMLQPSGAVDSRTWSTLVAMSRKPTSDEMNNRLVAGPAILKLGSSGDRVRNLQARLRQIGWYSGKITDFYGAATVTAVAGFQGRRAIPVTGEVDQRTWDRLVSMSRTPTSDEMHNVVPKPSSSGLDPRCMTGRSLCISKRTNSLAWVVNGKSQLRLDVRFGSYETPTREGAFAIGWKSEEWVSTIYHTPMPYAMFFSGGQAVHYSADFAERGYAGASHGCVNVRNLNGIRWLFSQVQVGDKVVVYQ